MIELLDGLAETLEPDFLSPGGNTAGKVGDRLEPLCREKVRYAQAATTGEAQDHHFAIARQLGETGRYIAHGDMHGTGDAGRGDFRRFTDVQQEQIAAGMLAGDELGGRHGADAGGGHAATSRVVELELEG